MDAKMTEDGEYFICVNIYDAENRKQSLKDCKNAVATIYNSETNEKLVEYKMTEE
jgi:stress response protein SCP2